jgi:hypothetical protein
MLPFPPFRPNLKLKLFRVATVLSVIVQVPTEPTPSATVVVEFPPEALLLIGDERVAKSLIDTAPVQEPPPAFRATRKPAPVDAWASPAMVSDASAPSE